MPVINALGQMAYGTVQADGTTAIGLSIPGGTASRIVDGSDPAPDTVDGRTISNPRYVGLSDSGRVVFAGNAVDTHGQLGQGLWAIDTTSSTPLAPPPLVEPSAIVDGVGNRIDEFGVPTGRGISNDRYTFLPAFLELGFGVSEHNDEVASFADPTALWKSSLAKATSRRATCQTPVSSTS